MMPGFFVLFAKTFIPKKSLLAALYSNDMK